MSSDLAVREPPASEIATSPPGEALLAMSGIVKRFPGITALDGVDFDLRGGEVHALFGENGAGKSTLINIIAGTFSPDAGSVVYRGEPLVNLTPHRARLIGISPVFQEFSLVPELTVEENLFLGRETSVFGLLNRRAMRARARSIIAELGFDLSPASRVGELSRAHQQMVEIAKALLADLRLLILDEPTASLTDAEVGRLFALIERLRASSVGITYVSHRISEIRRIADRITVLRDGRKIATVQAQEVTDRSLVELMTGRTIEALFPTVHSTPGDVALEVDHLSLTDGTVQGASLHVRAGEIVGIAGLVGCGKSELIRAVFGLKSIAVGSIQSDGKELSRPTPRTALAAGICYFPSDRAAEGLALSRSVRENASMAALDQPTFARGQLLRLRAERAQTRLILDKLGLRPPRIEQLVVNLSGGNRQKVVLARAMTRRFRVFLFDEPTVGIDVGAKFDVYELIRELAERGAAVVLVSSELPEVLNLSRRLYVMHRARVVAELTGSDITEQRVLAYFFQEREHVA